MKSKATEESADGNQFINALKSDWNTLYVAGSLALFASFALGAAFVRTTYHKLSVIILT